MIIIQCDANDCNEEIQVIDKKFPIDWIYCGDFEFCPKCKDKATDYNEI